MTTYVSRGAGRPAADAKTLKHAQRTALPPKGARKGWDGGGAAELLLQESRALRARLAAEREAATEEPAPVEDPKTTERLRRRAVRLAADQAEIDAAADMAADADTHEVDLDGPLATEDADEEPAALAALAVTEPPALPDAPAGVVRPDSATTPLPRKVAAVADCGVEHGWSVTVHTTDDLHDIVALRAGERVAVRYERGLWLGTNAARQQFVRQDGSVVLLRNASAARRQMSGQAPPVSSVRGHRAPTDTYKDEPVKRVHRSFLATSESALQALFVQGAVVTYRPAGSKVRTVTLPAGRGLVRVERSMTNSADSARILHMVGGDNVYRMVALGALLRVDPLA